MPSNLMLPTPGICGSHQLTLYKSGDAFGRFVGQKRWWLWLFYVSRYIQSKIYKPEKTPGTKIPRNVPPMHSWDTHNQFPMYAVGFVTALGM